MVALHEGEPIESTPRLELVGACPATEDRIGGRRDEEQGDSGSCRHAPELISQRCPAREEARNRIGAGHREECPGLVVHLEEGVHPIAEDIVDKEDLGCQHQRECAADQQQHEEIWRWAGVAGGGPLLAENRPDEEEEDTGEDEDGHLEDCGDEG